MISRRGTDELGSLHLIDPTADLPGELDHLLGGRADGGDGLADVFGPAPQRKDGAAAPGAASRLPLPRPPEGRPGAPERSAGS